MVPVVPHLQAFHPSCSHRALTSIGTQAAKTPMPELQHNLALLVDLAEADIARLDARLRHEQDTAAILVSVEYNTTCIGELVICCSAFSVCGAMLWHEQDTAAILVRTSRLSIAFDD